MKVGIELANFIPFFFFFSFFFLHLYHEPQTRQVQGRESYPPCLSAGRLKIGFFGSHQKFWPKYASQSRRRRRRRSSHSRSYWYPHLAPRHLSSSPRSIVLCLLCYFRFDSADGSLFSWGRGTFGRLGTSKEDDELFPVPIASSDSSNVSQVNYIGIATGAYHSLGLRGPINISFLLLYQLLWD